MPAPIGTELQTNILYKILLFPIKKFIKWLQNNAKFLAPYSDVSSSALLCSMPSKNVNAPKNVFFAYYEIWILFNAIPGPFLSSYRLKGGKGHSLFLHPPLFSFASKQIMIFLIVQFYANFQNYRISTTKWCFALIWAKLRTNPYFIFLHIHMRTIAGVFSYPSFTAVVKLPYLLRTVKFLNPFPGIAFGIIISYPFDQIIDFTLPHALWKYLLY